MAFKKNVCLLIALICWVAPVPLSAFAQVTTLYQSVAKAIDYSPQLRALGHNRQAIEFDLTQARARYRPSIDLLMGYGLEQHSDGATRRIGTDSEWDSRSDASLRLAQKVYDGGETSQQVSINQAILDSAIFQIQDATQAVSLNAISAHLEVFKQHELVALAEKNLTVHRDIYRLLAEREQAGAGNIADVTKTQARMARAQSNLFVRKADLKRAIANYVRLVGVKPGELAFHEVPDKMPESLEEALMWAEQKNPGFLAFDADLMEADARVSLAGANFKPKINVELGSSYNDNLEGDQSWQNTNEAMLVLRWNLFNGGQDKAEKSAALSRKHQVRSDRDDKLFELREATTSAWAVYLSLGEQKEAYQDAAAYSQKTFNAYLKQFSVSRRSLLDVLSADNDYFQSASQLVTAIVDETIAAFHILKLGGELRIPKDLENGGEPANLTGNSRAIALTAATETASPVRQTPPFKIMEEDPVQVMAAVEESPARISTATEENLAPAKASGTALAPAKPSLLYSMEIGPCLDQDELDRAREALRDYGGNVRQISGSGPVKMIRLLEGIYPPAEAHRRLDALKKKIDSAFLLPEGAQLGLYTGSYHQAGHAHHLAALLGQKRIKVTPLTCEVEMRGRILVVPKVDRKTADTIIERMAGFGLNTKMTGPVSSLMK